MHRLWEANALGTAPSLPIAGSLGFPTDGDLMTAVPPTNPGAYWFHQITEELMAVISAGGFTPNSATLTQVRDSIRTIAGARLGHSYASADWAYLEKFAGLILQWGSIAYPGTGGNIDTVTVTYPITFTSTVLSVWAIHGNRGSVAVSNSTPPGLSSAQLSLDGYSLSLPAGTLRFFAIGV